MSRPDRDEERVEHMRSAAREAIRFVKGKSRAELSRDRKLALALVKEIEIIGEAAARVSVPHRRRYPEVPWEEIVATRNRLIHGYFEIDLDVVWNTVKRDLPELLKTLGK